MINISNKDQVKEVTTRELSVYSRIYPRRSLKSNIETHIKALLELASVWADVTTMLKMKIQSVHFPQVNNGPNKAT